MTKSKQPSDDGTVSTPQDDRPAAVRVTAAKCVRCGQPVQPRFRPFCSQRCADVDLGQWASGTYRVPTAEAAAGPEDDEG